MGCMFHRRLYLITAFCIYTAFYMVIIDSITVAWVQIIGGAETVYTLLSMMFVFMVAFIFYKIST